MSSIEAAAREAREYVHGLIAEQKARLDELEQKSARHRGGDDRPESLGAQFIRAKADDLARVASDRGKTSMEVKATLTSATTDAAGSVGGLIVPQRDQIVGMPRRRLTIRNLLDVRNATSGSVEYPRQVGRPDGADMVAEGVLKPESDMQFELATVPMRVIAHWTKASRQVLDDIPQLQGMIDSELIYGLALKEEAELLYGDGTGQHLDGMVSQATTFADAAGVGAANEIDVIGLAILQATLTDVPPDGIAMHPADWWRMRLAKGDDGKYLLGDPGVVVAPSLFGLPIVPTTAMTARKFLVGSFGSQVLYDRWAARVEVGFEGQDFTKNLVTVLAEERVGFACTQPQAMIYGDFDTALGS